MTEEQWVFVCDSDELEDEEALRFDHGSRTFAIYNLAGEIFATDGHCTHEKQHLADGLVYDGIIECPLHMGQFDIKTGEAISGPVCINLQTYGVKSEGGKIFIRL